MTLGKNSTSCLDDLWEYCPLFHVCRPYWKPFVAPGNKQIHFLLARLHFVSFSLFLIYPPYWIQLLPLATRILFPVCIGLHLCNPILAYILYILIYITVCCPWQQLLDASESNQILLSYQLCGPLRQSESEDTSGLYFLYILFILLKFVSDSSTLEPRGVMSGLR